MPYNGEVSAPLSPSITASQLKSVLDGFNGIDNVSVTGSSGSFTVTFGGTQSTTNMQQIFGDAANASNGSTVRTITSAYDAASQVTSVSDPSSTINYTLDNLGRATTIAQSVNGLTPTVSLAQAFDAMNNRTELKATITSTLDFKNTYQYDQLQRLTDIVQQGQSGGNSVTAKHITQSYNALSQRTQIARYQSTGTTNAVATTDFTYDSANRLSGIAHKQGTTNLNTYAYSYDPLSRIASIVSTLVGTDTSSYDQTSQLVGATHTSQSNETYGFDANGNQNTTGFTTGTNNQTTAGLGFTYTFDDEGNRTSKTETATGKVEEYTWDYRNRLTKVVFRNSSGGTIVKQVDYEYDPYNRLVHRTFDADGAGSGAATDQFWVYDQGINAVLQFDGLSASNLSHRYLWSNSVDELLADEQIAGSNTLWGLADHLGSLRDIADLNEGTGVTSITNHRILNSFGKLISENNAAVDMLFAFTGKQYDEATALQHNLFRWYDPALGQWLSEDPLGFAAGDENVRRYVGNGVVDSIDPLGLQEPWEDPSLTVERIKATMTPIQLGKPLASHGNGIPSGSFTPPPRILRPNIGAGTGTFHYSQNSIQFRVSNIDCQELERRIYEDLKSFAHFNGGANTIATVELNSTGIEAYFDMLGINGTISDIKFITGNADRSPVKLTFDDANSTVVAQTLEGHMLEGVRIWTVYVNSGPFQDADVTIITAAFDRKIGIVNNIGAWAVGTAAQLAVWDQYLTNIMNAYSGIGLSQHPLLPAAPLHFDRDTGSATLPINWP